jgi:hypothetical protein
MKALLQHSWKSSVVYGHCYSISSYTKDVSREIPRVSPELSAGKQIGLQNAGKNDSPIRNPQKLRVNFVSQIFHPLT